MKKNNISQLQKIQSKLLQYKDLFEKDTENNKEQLAEIEKMLKKTTLLTKELEKKKSSKKIFKEKDKFYTIHDSYIEECEQQRLTDAKRKEYTTILAELIVQAKADLEILKIEKDKSGATEETIGAYDSLAIRVADYEEKFKNLPTDCSEEKEYKIIQVVFYDIPYTGCSVTANAKGGDLDSSQNKSELATVETIIPQELFKEWDKIEAAGGQEAWGDYGMIAIVKGNKNTRKITIQVEGKAGGYGQDMLNYRATFYADLRAISRPINIKIPSGKDKWKNAIWDYKLENGETITKKVEQDWKNRYGKLYRKYNP